MDNFDGYFACGAYCDEKEVPDGMKGRILPFELVQEDNDCLEKYVDAVKYNERVECAHDLGNSIWFGALVKREDKKADLIPLENYKITKNCKD